MSLKANAKLGSLTVQVEAPDIKSLFEELSFFAETPTECECSSKNIVPRHRTWDDNDYYEFLCLDCGMTKHVGQAKKGGRLFCSKKDEWKKYTKESE